MSHSLLVYEWDILCIQYMIRDGYPTCSFTLLQSLSSVSLCSFTLLQSLTFVSSSLPPDPFQSHAQFLNIMTCRSSLLKSQIWSPSSAFLYYSFFKCSLIFFFPILLLTRTFPLMHNLSSISSFFFNGYFYQFQ